MCVFRDVGMCFVIASLFEILEVSLQHLIPEFAECWWDSVFMDSLGANALGIFLGYLTLRYLDSRHYQWIAYRPKGVTSRIKRVMWLFTPFSWSNCKWFFFGCLWCGGWRRQQRRLLGNDEPATGGRMAQWILCTAEKTLANRL